MTLLRADVKAFQHKPVHPLEFKDDEKLAARWNAEKIQVAYYNGQEIGDIMDYGYAVYPHIFGERLGAYGGGIDFDAMEHARATLQMIFDGAKVKPILIDRSNAGTLMDRIKPDPKTLDA